MEERTERDRYEDRPQEVRRGATGQVSDGIKPIFLSFLAGTTSKTHWLLVARSLLFSLNWEA